MKNTLLIALVISIVLIGCNQVTLDNNEAEALIKKTLELNSTVLLPSKNKELNTKTFKQSTDRE